MFLDEAVFVLHESARGKRDKAERKKKEHDAGELYPIFSGEDAEVHRVSCLVGNLLARGRERLLVAGC